MRFNLIPNKRKIIILIVAILIYFLILKITSVLKNKNLSEVYVLTNNYIRGEEIKVEDVKLIKIDKSNLNINNVNTVDNIVAKSNLGVGQILTYENILKKDEYKMVEENKERILINVSDTSSVSSELLTKGSIVNIYYTGRTSQLESIIPLLENSSCVKSSSITDGYSTFLLLKNVQVINIYDSDGVKINNDNNLLKSNKITSVEIEVESNISMLIENLKNYGKFEFTVKR